MVKQITFLVAAFATILICSISCQKDLAEDRGIGRVNDVISLTAVFQQDINTTKVSYEEVSNQTVFDLKPSWEIGDKIIGFSESGTAFEFAVTAINGGFATLEGTDIPDGTVHLIYKSGAGAGDIEDKSLAVSYAGQSGDKSMPAVMLSDGEIAGGKGTFTFSNAGAVIGIDNAVGLPAGAVIDEVIIMGKNLSAGVVAMNGNTLKLTSTANADDAISTVTLNGVTVGNGDDRKLNKPILIAVPMGAVINSVTLAVGLDDYRYTLGSAKTINAASYKFINTQEFIKMPARDLGSSETANCYIVPSTLPTAGRYKFPATVKGNGKNPDGSAADGISPKSAKILWQADGDGKTQQNLFFFNPTVQDGYVSFRTRQSYWYGSALIAVYSGENCTGDILWSWHIWFPGVIADHEYANNAGTLMDRSLGATYSGASKYSYGLLYQWGRKDPFRAQTPESIVATSAENGTVAYSVKHPETFITSETAPNDWLYSERDNSLWGAGENGAFSTKTMYDPCPAGYRVPDGGPNGVWVKANYNGNTWSYGGDGYAGRAVGPGWYFGTGYLNCSDGILSAVGSWGFTWSCTPDSNNIYDMYVRNNGYVYNQGSNGRAYGFSVRCLKIQ